VGDTDATGAGEGDKAATGAGVGEGDFVAKAGTAGVGEAGAYEDDDDDGFWAAACNDGPFDARTVELSCPAAEFCSNISLELDTRRPTSCFASCALWVLQIKNAHKSTIVQLRSNKGRESLDYRCNKAERKEFAKLEQHLRINA
jgi:hypothetical protein